MGSKHSIMWGVCFPTRILLGVALCFFPLRPLVPTLAIIASVVALVRFLFFPRADAWWDRMSHGVFYLGILAVAATTLICPRLVSARWIGAILIADAVFGMISSTGRGHGPRRCPFARGGSTTQ